MVSGLCSRLDYLGSSVKWKTKQSTGRIPRLLRAKAIASNTGEHYIQIGANPERLALLGFYAANLPVKTLSDWNRSDIRVPKAVA